MKLSLSIALAVVLATLIQGARADTIYKCVQADGKVAFSSLPCAGKAKEARQLSVPPPEADDVSAARLQQERAKLAAADRQFRQRQGARDAGYRSGSGGGTSIANIANVRASKRVEQTSKKELERQEAARLNKARIGNCSMPRPEANCL